MTTRILVTGGNGFLGSHLVERLRAVSGNVVFAPPVTEFDLLVPDDVEMPPPPSATKTPTRSTSAPAKRSP